MNEPANRKNMKTKEYIPFTNKSKTRFTKKLRVDSMMILNKLRSNLSLAESFKGVSVPLSEDRNLVKKTAAAYANSNPPAKNCPVKQKKRCSAKKRKAHRPSRKRKHCDHDKNKRCTKKFKTCHKKKVIQVRTLEFIEENFEGLTVGNEFLYLPPQDTSLSTNIMYMIQNQSHDATLEFQVEVSPNKEYYYVDTTGITIKPRSNYVGTPLRFAKFTRVGIKTVEQGTSANVDVYYQTQTQLTKTKRISCKKKGIFH